MSPISLSTSVIIPVLNGERHLAEALASVICQLGKRDEILVVDDGSTDGTSEALRPYRGRVTVLQGPGRGPSAARNIALAVARGHFIAFLDHDDLWPAGRHAALTAALCNGSADAVVGRIRILIEEACEDTSEYIRHYEGKHHPPILMSCLYRRRLIEQVGFFDETLRFGEDTDYYLRLREAGASYAQCDADSLIYRRHSGNATNNRPPQTAVSFDILARKRARQRKAADD